MEVPEKWAAVGLTRLPKMTGDLWSIPGGHKAIEVEGSTRDILRLAVIPPDWPWLKPPIDVARVLCTPLPMKYYGGKVPNTKEN